MTGGTARYVPGRWSAVRGRLGFLIADLDIADPALGRCLSALSGETPAESVLQVFAEARGIADLPGFALVTVDEDQLRLVVRQPAKLEVTDDSGTHALTSAVGTTWVDSRMPAEGTAITLCGDADVDPAAQSVDFPLGLMQAARVELPATGTDPRVDTTESSASASDILHVEDEQSPVIDAPDPVAQPAAATPASSTYAALLAVDPPSPDPEDRAGAPAREQVAYRDPEVTWAPLADEQASARPDLMEPVSDPGPPSAPPSADEIIDGVPWELPAAPPQSPAPPTTPAPTSVPVAPPRPPQSLPTFEPPRQTAGGAPVAASHAAVTHGAPKPVRGPDVAEDLDEVEHTINREALARARTSRPAPTPTASPTVLASRCSFGHLSPAYAPVCRVCQTSLAGAEPVQTTRPSLGYLHLSTGDTIELDRGVILGRAPQAPEDALERPHLLQLSTLGLDLSRMHAEVRLEGWHVMVRDLGSANGTTVIPPHGEPERLRPHQMHLLAHGTVINLADLVDIRFEVGG